MNAPYDDRDRSTVSEHHVQFDIDPQLETGIVSRPDGLLLRLDADPAMVGRAVLAYLRTARRLALDDADDGGPRRLNAHEHEGGQR